MERREQYKRVIMFFASALILAVQTAIYAYVWFSYYDSRGVIRTTFVRGNWVVVGMYALMLFFFYKMYGGFKVGYLRVLDVLYSQIASVLCVNGITYLQMALIGRWTLGAHILPMFYVTAVDLVIVVLWVLMMRWIYVHIYPPRKMLLIYGEKNPKDLIRKISSREDKYDICESIHLGDGMDKLKSKIDCYKAVIMGDMPSHERNLLLKYCFEKDIRCYCIPKISDVMIMSSDSIHLFDTPLLLFRNRGLTIEQRIAKRLTDLIISGIGVVIASPFMLIIALLIKCYDRGPVFYRQERLTERGRTFYVLKFRSMRVDSEKEGARLAMKQDNRVTPVGKVLRNIHFDELPQLFNILKGDMSLVGPRPERPQITKEYKEKIPEFDYRLKVKAGLTGYAQVYGKYNTTPYDKLKLDLSYIENYTYLLDWKLMLMTVKILFQKENTEGVEAWQVTAATKEEEAKKENK
ncbi:MAG: sugar transferase [Clostridiales bacterium]|nr:sugar transferase [Clostridiales bacterium]MDU3240373.1 sugar transferase [Clostridiales bacterium]